jgi:hypothetical protein
MMCNPPRLKPEIERACGMGSRSTAASRPVRRGTGFLLRVGPALTKTGPMRGAIRIREMDQPLEVLVSSRLEGTSDALGQRT